MLPILKAMRLTSATLVCALASTLSYAAEPPARQVAAALDRLDLWLGKESNGNRWRDYLKTADLRQQLAAAAQIDRQAIAASARQFASGAPGLSDPHFTAVGTRLDAWLAELMRPEDLPSAALAAKEAFREVNQADVDAARSKLRRSAEQLDRYLGRGTNGQAWRKFLLWDSPQPALAEGATPDFRTLDEVATKLASQRPGLQAPQFAAVRQSLDAYSRLARVAADPQVKETYAARLDTLSKALETYAQHPAEAEARQIGEALGWLEDFGQAPALVAAVRRQYCHPNFLVQMSEPLVAVGLARSVNRTEPVTDLILGTRIRGTGHTTGNVSVDLVPNDQWGVVDSLFNGHVESRTVGRNGPARIDSAGHTSFQARKRIFVDHRGIQSPPATAAASTRSKTLGVSAGGPLMNSIARNKVAGSKSQAEAISADHAEDRLTDRVDEDANPKIREANQKYQTHIRQPLADRGQFPKRLRFSTTADALHCVGLQCSEGQLAAPAPAPEIPGRQSLSLRVHESALNNLAAGTLAGEKLTKKEFQQEFKEMFGKVPEEWDQEEGTWVITFHSEQPITVLFSDSGVTVTLRVRRVEGVVDSRTPWRITAQYKLEKSGPGLKAVRQGEQIEVEPLNEDAGGRSVAEKANVRRQFEKFLFKKEYVQEGLELPGDWAKAGKLPLSHLLSEKGWLALAWVQP